MQRKLKNSLLTWKKSQNRAREKFDKNGTGNALKKKNLSCTSPDHGTMTVKEMNHTSLNSFKTTLQNSKLLRNCKKASHFAKIEPRVGGFFGSWQTCGHRWWFGLCGTSETQTFFEDQWARHPKTFWIEEEDPTVGSTFDWLMLCGEEVTWDFWKSSKKSPSKTQIVSDSWN